MTKKIISIVLIFMITFMITIDLYKEESQAIVPAVVLIPAATYAIYAGLACAGVIGDTSADSDYLANNYINKLSEYEKARWNALATYGLATGSMIIDSLLGDSLTSYAEDNFVEGDNTKYEDSTFETAVPNKSYKSIGGYSLSVVSSGGYWYVCINGQASAGKSFYSETEAMTALPLCSLVYVLGSTYDYIMVEYQGQQTGGKAILKGTIVGQGEIPGAARNVTADLDGIGAAMAVAMASIKKGVELKFPPITGSKSADKGVLERAANKWFNTEKGKINKTNKPNWSGKGGAALAIVALAAQTYWSVNSILEELTASPDEEVPEGNIAMPTPDELGIPALPDIPPNAPTEDNPEIKTRLNEPVITTVDNGDGTSTETKRQTSTKTERYYDSNGNKWVSTDTNVLTTTTTSINNETQARTETAKVEEILPGTVTQIAPPTYDDGDINPEPLKQALGSLTTKFPFSLPWDLYNTYAQFIGDEWDGQIKIQAHTPGNSIIDFDFDLDFSMFDDLRRIVKQIELILFDVGLILSTRKLMGGGV